jgi:hypothetical protein
MRCFRLLPVFVLLGLFCLGCSRDGYFNARGRIVKGGRPLILPEGQGLRVFFCPSETGGTRYDSFAASYDPTDGSFEVMGKDGRGLPPGKYYIGLQLMEKKEDLLGGRLLGPKSGLSLDVVPGAKDLVINLDESPFDKALEITQKKMSNKAARSRGT